MIIYWKQIITLLPSSVVPQDSKIVAKQHRLAYLRIGIALVHELSLHVCVQRVFAAASSKSAANQGPNQGQDWDIPKALIGAQSCSTLTCFQWSICGQEERVTPGKNVFRRVTHYVTKKQAAYLLYICYEMYLKWLTWPGHPSCFLILWKNGS